MLTRLKSAVVRHGVIGTLRLVPHNLRYLCRSWTPSARRAAARDREFDALYGTDTGGLVEVGNYRDLSPERLRGASRYETLGRATILGVLNALAVDFHGFTLVDYGSGKGRVLLVATELPFVRIMGVEISPALHEIARRNIGLFPGAKDRDVVLVRSDAAAFAPPLTDTVFFFYDPFDEAVLAQVNETICKLHAEADTRVFAVYYSPVHRRVFDRSAFWRIRAEAAGWVGYERARPVLSPPGSSS